MNHHPGAKTHQIAPQGPSKHNLGVEKGNSKCWKTYN